jgi:membrane fusion protein, multidrug efflux system
MHPAECAFVDFRTRQIVKRFHMLLEAARRHSSHGVLALGLSVFLAGCQQEAEAPPPEPRQVRTTTIELRDNMQKATFTGRIEAEDEVPLAFRISGRLIENTAVVGQRVEVGDLIARLESQNEENSLRAAAASLAATEAQLAQANGAYERQRTLLDRGFTTRSNFELAQKGARTAESQVEAAEAQLRAAEDLLGFTELRADQPGVYTTVGPAAGEVVQAGQMIARLARMDGRDAVFDIPAQVLSTAPANPKITVSLANDASVKAEGFVREVSPQADPVTRTFEVKVGLIDPPEAMRLGATVNGILKTDGGPGVEIPASALTRANQQPAVWIVNPADMTVSLRNVEIARHGETLVWISEGLGEGDVVVTAGVQALHPGQKVRLLGAPS